MRSVCGMTRVAKGGVRAAVFPNGNKMASKVGVRKQEWEGFETYGLTRKSFL